MVIRQFRRLTHLQNARSVQYVRQLEHAVVVVGPEVFAEATNDRVGLLDLDSDRQGVISEQSRQRVEVSPDRGPTRRTRNFVGERRLK